MGGIVILSAAVIGYFVGKIINGETPSASALLVIFMMLGLGLVGFIDDFLKVRKQQSLGLSGWAKIAGQGVVATIFAVLALQFPNRDGLTPASTSISLFRDLPIDLFIWGSAIGMVLFIGWIYLLVASASNGVNIADGLDGLASGSAIFAIGAYVVIGFWQFNQSCRTVTENFASCYEVRDPLDTAVIAAAIVGACLGFLWWNTSPAQIFMGDTGSLGLGGALAALAVVSRTELLLILIGGIFVIVTGSVVIQRVFFKLTKWKTGVGKRVFLMSPLHHHFELKGWAEITVVVRFWIIAALCVVAGVGLFYVEWIYGI
jgi:phospho-N-acetylmuramoyl-pentapeptide-transferase